MWQNLQTAVPLVASREPNIFNCGNTGDWGNLRNIMQVAEQERIYGLKIAVCSTEQASEQAHPRAWAGQGAIRGGRGCTARVRQRAGNDKFALKLCEATGRGAPCTHTSNRANFSKLQLQCSTRTRSGRLPGAERQSLCRRRTCEVMGKGRKSYRQILAEEVRH